MQYLIDFENLHEWQKQKNQQSIKYGSLAMSIIILLINVNEIKGEILEFKKIGKLYF